MVVSSMTSTNVVAVGASASCARRSGRRQTPQLHITSSIICHTIWNFVLVTIVLLNNVGLPSVAYADTRGGSTGEFEFLFSFFLHFSFPWNSIVLTI